MRRYRIGQDITSRAETDSAGQCVRRTVGRSKDDILGLEMGQNRSQNVVRCQKEAQGLLGERVVKTPEASSMVFLRAVSLATL